MCATMYLLHSSHSITLYCADYGISSGARGRGSPARGSTDSTQTTGGSEVAAGPQAAANSARSCGSSFLVRLAERTAHR